MSVLHDRMKQKKFENRGQEAMLNLIAVSAALREKLNLICQEKNISNK